MPPYVYRFGRDGAEGDPTDKQRLGGKGAGLAAMVRLGVPVPPGFTIATDACAWRMAHGSDPPELAAEVDAALAHLERELSRRFGDARDPLLVSVRSGAAVSMPGMMDTILNLGLTRAGVDGLAQKSGNPRFAWDSYRRLVQMYGNVVLGCEHHAFEAALAEARRAAGATTDAELPAAALQAVVERYAALVQQHTGAPFPDDPRAQLRGAIDAVFRSWDNPRAQVYRRAQGIAGLRGTAVTVQAMVFGNLSDDSATGVCFTRDPGTGANEFFGEFLQNAQGEDVVAGLRTPEPIARLAERLPDSYRQLVAAKTTLERHFRDLLDLEFTVERGRLYMLQVRGGKRAGLAAFRIATEMQAAGELSEAEALARVQPEHVEHLLFPQFDAAAKRRAIEGGARLATGLGAGPGAASGRCAFTAEDAERRAAAGERVILVRAETSPEDIGGMMAAAGICTTTGGRTSHAAVVARGLGKTCVVGCGALAVDAARQRLVAGERVLGPKDAISIDGFTGEVLAGAVATEASDVLAALDHDAAPSPGSTAAHFRTVLGWADQVRRLRVRANADTPADATVARRLGAEGIGLCRTEHMFFAPEERIEAMRAMILARNTAGREHALARLLPMQREDFVGILAAMDGLPVTIRLLDPPLHEFLPLDLASQSKLASALGIAVEGIQRSVEQLHEQNPMLGHRGCRLGITYPEIYAMQARAILQAVAERVRAGGDPRPEIMLPLIGNVTEFRFLATWVRTVADAVAAAAGVSVPYTVGTMIEVPRAALTAGAIAAEAEFFSFGTNDLTQMTLGISRDDAGRFLVPYQELGVLPADPFRSIDPEGVGRLIELATTEGRAARPGLKVGICGEHGGDPQSIAFCHHAGLDYVSCSPYRVPVARLAAARAALDDAKR